MNSSNKPSNFAKYNKLILITLGLIVLIFGAWFVLRDYIFLPFDNRNFAEEVGRPVEQSFTGLGAKSVCIDAYNGRGADSRQPSYTVYLQIPAERQRAIQIIQQAFKDSGYNAVHSTLQNRGPVNVADQFIDNWYYDNSKVNHYSSLQQGNIELTASISEEGTHSYYCDSTAAGSGGKSLTSDAKQTGVILNVRLPSFK